MSVTLEHLKRRLTAAKGGSETLRAFAELLFGKADPDFMTAFDPDTLSAMAAASLRRVQQPLTDDLHVSVYNPSYAADGWEAPYTVAEVHLQDRPFIVDSLRAALRREGYAVYHILHPILEVVRDEQGAFGGLGGEAANREAYELYFIERLDGEDERRKLQATLRTVLEDVKLATRDYQAMQQKTRELRDYVLGLQAQNAPEERARAEDLDEYAAFLGWLDEGNYVFLGYREYDLFDLGGVPHLKVTPGSGLGILSKLQESAYTEAVPLASIPASLRERVTGGPLLIVTKTNAASTVHRPARMDYLGLKKLSDTWEVKGEQRFVGLFTSKALSTPVEHIPILRLKLRRVLELDRAVPGSHDYKQIASIFNSMPREELFWTDAAQLHQDIRAVMGLEEERGVRLTVRPDPLGRGLAAMVVMPRERFNAEVRRAVQQLLFDKLAATHVDYQLAMGEDESQLRFHFFFTTETRIFDVDTVALEREVIELTRTWDDHLRERLITARGEVAGRRLTEKYRDAFDEAYKADTSPQTALRDIEQLERLEGAPYLVELLNAPEDWRGEATTLIKIYHPERSLVLSDVMPMLENLGFRVLEQISYHAQFPGHLLGIDIFRVHDRQGRMIDVREHGERLTEALTALLTDAAESDPLNQLVLYGGLGVRQVALLRAYGMYYGQLSAVTSRSFSADTLLRHPQVAALLYAAFAAKFNPAFDGDREAALERVKSDFLDALEQVHSLPEDTLLRGLMNLIDASVRSNYFLGKPVISFKLESRRVSAMPEPRPLFEIAVSGLGVEGTHLRGGLVARGGIRWSDRPDDFRTEVLGLMKTQMTKNAVIVPVGSKGGFVLKRAPQDPAALRDYVRAQYQTYIRGLLDLTDNLRDGRVVHPAELVVYDGPDPYLVVAADKGTATFSDLANATAAEYGFWLGDAFASGGSYGYDHKKEGITARGAWECALRHFREMGLDVRRDPFTAVGIGDMAGDVFGNGMIYTDKLRLQAAFNHQHIFLDPDPDPATSYQERKRLFELPRSSWRDYDTGLISAGGGVYERSAKEIPLSAQAREMLGVTETALSGQALIRAILRMPADLLWNGGIGTYVKASQETHADVGDSANDLVRVSAPELRCKVVGEGGNLGFTQLARVEYALAGGRINTDAIDNSAGVDMSDHEVNIKVLLQPLVDAGELSFVQRNRLLAEMTDEVSALVLADNYFQSLALSMAERRSQRDLSLFESLAEYLSDKGGLDANVEFLPNHRTLLERAREGQGYTRPELAILMAYAKMGMYRRLLETDFPDEAYFQHYLFRYFPGVLAERFPEAIRGHRLRREIIATQFTNTVVDLLGITFVHRSLRDTGAQPVEVIRAALIALEFLDARALMNKLFALDGKVAAEAQYDALDEIAKAVEGVVIWMLLSGKHEVAVASFVGAYREPLLRLRQGLGKLLPESEKARYKARERAWKQRGLTAEMAAQIAALDYLPSSVGIIEVSERRDAPLPQVASAFFELGERLSLGWLRDSLSELPSPTKWDKVAKGGLVMELRRTQRRLTDAYFAARETDGGMTLGRFLEDQERLLRRYDDALADIRREDELTLAGGEVLSRLLAQIADRIGAEA